MSIYSYIGSERGEVNVLTDEQARSLAELFHLLGEPSRLRIVMACLDEPITVGDLSQRLGLSPSLTSHHLRLLRAQRVLKQERRGRNIFYSAADAHVRRMVSDMAEHVREPAQGAGWIS